MKAESEKKARPATANILIAQGFWQDDIFNRSVILIFDHDEHGSTGIILNKSSEVEMNLILPYLNINNPLYYGGPHGDEFVGFIHDVSSLKDAILINEGLYWCGDINEVKEKVENQTIDVSRIKFFAGFVQWGPGKLYEEIKQNKWWINSLSVDDILKTDYKKLWSYSLIKKGNSYGLMHALADPILN